MGFQDYFTKFISLHSLKTKATREVAYKLIDIFYIVIWNSKHTTIKPYYKLLNSNCLKIVQGKLCHSKSQRSVEQPAQR